MKSGDPPCSSDSQPGAQSVRSSQASTASTYSDGGVVRGVIIERCNTFVVHTALKQGESNCPRIIVKIAGQLTVASSSLSRSFLFRLRIPRRSRALEE